jgi:hypothetical protein
MRRSPGAWPIGPSRSNLGKTISGEITNGIRGGGKTLWRSKVGTTNYFDLILRSRRSWRLEGWTRVRAVRPSFETRASFDKLKSALLRMRSMIFARVLARITPWNGIEPLTIGTLVIDSMMPIGAREFPAHPLRTPCSDEKIPCFPDSREFARKLSTLLKDSRFRELSGIRLQAIEIAGRIDVGQRRYGRKSCKFPDHAVADATPTTGNPDTGIAAPCVRALARHR